MRILILTTILLSLVLFIISILNIKIMLKIRKHINHLRAKVYDKYKIITLCGSTKFKKEFEEIQKELSLQGHIVLSVGCFGHSGDKEVWSGNNKQILDDIHKRKIDLSSAIVVVNKDGYIGESTKSEIKYAETNNKEIIYWYN